MGLKTLKNTGALLLGRKRARKRSQQASAISPVLSSTVEHRRPMPMGTGGGHDPLRYNRVVAAGVVPL